MSYFSELTKKLALALLKKDKEMANDYNRLFFNAFEIHWTSSTSPSEEDAIVVRKFCLFCINSGIKVEALSRMIRKLQEENLELRDSNYENRRTKSVKLVQKELGYKD